MLSIYLPINIVFHSWSFVVFSKQFLIFSFSFFFFQVVDVWLQPSFNSWVSKFSKVYWTTDEDEDHIAHSHRERWNEKVSNLVLEWDTEEVEEHEVRGAADEEEE